MGMNLIGRSPLDARGESFDASFWTWRPLAHFITEFVAPDVAKNYKRWTTNDGDRLGFHDSVAVADTSQDATPTSTSSPTRHTRSAAGPVSAHRPQRPARATGPVTVAALPANVADIDLDYLYVTLAAAKIDAERWKELTGATENKPPSSSREGDTTNGSRREKRGIGSSTKSR